MYQVELMNGQTTRLSASQVKALREEIKAFVLPSQPRLVREEGDPWILSEVYPCDGL